MERPELNTTISVDDFRNFYWLKEELIAFCKVNNINRRGGKTEISARIIHFLETGETIKETPEIKKKNVSSFDWNKESLTLDTLITDNYKNTENVRQFFTGHIGKQFRFNVSFMNWIKLNVGKTLGEAVKEWYQIKELSKTNKTQIEPQFEYNTYIRYFLEDNPDKTLKDAIKYWKLKKSIKGNNQYERSDLDLK